MTPNTHTVNVVLHYEVPIHAEFNDDEMWQAAVQDFLDKNQQFSGDGVLIEHDIEVEL